MTEEKLIKADGLEDAIIGVGSRINMPEVLIYSYNKCVKIFMERDGMTHEEAIEWMEYNVVGAWVGETTPIFVHEILKLQKENVHIFDLNTELHEEYVVHNKFKEDSLIVEMFPLNDKSSTEIQDKLNRINNFKYLRYWE